MLIGSLSKTTGLSRDTIRFYEREGLISTPVRRDNNYKEYPEDTPRHLRFIKQLQARGFTLSEIRSFLSDSHSGSMTCGEVGQRFREKVVRIDEQIATLQAERERLTQSFSACADSTPRSICKPVRAKELG